MNRNINFFPKLVIEFVAALVLTLITWFGCIGITWLFYSQGMPYPLQVIIDRGNIPFFILWAGWWAILELCFKFFKFVQISLLTHQFISWFPGYLEEKEIGKINDSNSPKILEMLQKKEEKKVVDTILSRKFHSCLQIMPIELAKIKECLAESFSLDGESLRLEYKFLKYLVYLVPLLGFLGTVVGIGAAMVDIGKGLAMFQGEEITISNFIGAIELGIQNLKVAFDTTLLGLIISAIVVFFYTVLETGDEMLLMEAEKFCEEKMVPLFQEENRLLTATSKIAQHVLHYMPEEYLAMRMMLAEFRGEAFDFELSSQQQEKKDEH